MQRKQFYPSPELFMAITKEAENRGISESTLIVDILNEYFGLKKSKAPTLTELTKIILKEIEDFVSTAPVKKPFDLSVSPTFNKIDMAEFSVQGKTPKATRASIGRSFAAKIGTGPFKNVRKAMVKDKSGKEKPLLSKNNALMYEVFK